MGRTNPTFRDFLRRFEEEWQPFRRGLRRPHKQHFDRLFERARNHADAAAYVNHRDPELAAVMAVLLDQEIELKELKERVEELEG